MSGRADVVCESSRVDGCDPEHGSGVGPASVAGLDATAPWPMTDTLTLGALPTAVASARGHARVVVSEWGMADTAETVAHVVSELVTNAILASTDANQCRVEERVRADGLGAAGA